MLRFKKLDDCSAVILASGKGSRLGELCRNKPKCLLEFNNVPFIHYLINWIVKSGVDNIVITTCIYGEQIAKEINEHWDNISIVAEKELVSTVASAYHGVNKVSTPYSFIMVADTIWDVVLSDLYEFNLKKEANATVLATKRRFVANFGLVKALSTGQIVSLYKSPEFKDIHYDIRGSAMGLYIVKTQKFLTSLNIGKDTTFEWESISRLLPKVWAFWCEDSYLDYGEPAALDHLHANPDLIIKHFGSFP